MLPFVLRYLAVTLLLTAAAAASAQNETILRYKLDKGQKLKYVAKNDIDAKVVTSSLTTKIKVNYQFEVTLDVLAKDSRGASRLKATIDEVRFVIKANTDAISFEVGYDTKKKQWLGDPNPVADMKQYVGEVAALKGKAFEFQVGTRGQIKELSLSKDLDQLLQTLHEDLDSKDLEAGMQQLLGSVFLLVPSNAVKKGSEWTAEQQTKTEHRTITYTYSGEAEKGKDHVESVAFSVKRKIVKPPAKFKSYKLKKQKFTGNVLFDTDAGIPAEVTAVQQETAVEVPNRGLKATTTGTSRYSLKLVK